MYDIRLEHARKNNDFMMLGERLYPFIKFNAPTLHAIMQEVETDNTYTLRWNDERVEIILHELQDWKEILPERTRPMQQGMVREGKPTAAELGDRVNSLLSIVEKAKHEQRSIEIHLYVV